MEPFGTTFTILSFVIGFFSFIIGTFAAVLTWQTVKNGKIFKDNFSIMKDNFSIMKDNFSIMKDNFSIMKEHFVRMDERFIKMDEKREQQHNEVVKLLEKGFGDMGGWTKRTEEILEKGFGILIKNVNEIRTAKP